MTEFSEHLDGLSAEKRLYLLQALPLHLLKADQNERLSRLLTDLDFIEAKCSAELTYDLLNDYLLMSEKIAAGCFSAAQRINLEEFAQFLKSQSHILSVQPLLTFQQAANQAPDTAPHLAASRHWERGSGPPSWLKVIHSETNSNAALISLRTNKRPISTSLSFSGHRVAVSDGDIWIYGTESGQEIYHYAAQSQRSASVIALSPDGNLLAYAEKSNTGSDQLSILDIKDGEKFETLNSASLNIRTLRFSATGKLLAIGGTTSNGGMLAVWDVLAGTLLWKRVISGAIVRELIFLPGDLILVAGQGNGICSFWNSDNGELERSIQVCSSAITDLSVSQDGNYLATSSQKHACQITSIYEPNQREPHSFRPGRAFHTTDLRNVVFTGHHSSPSAIAFLDDSKLISGDVDGFCHVWSAEDGKLLSSPISGEGKILSIELSGNQEFLLVTSVEDQKSQIFAKEQFARMDHSRVNQASFLCFLDDSELARAWQDGTLEIFSLTNKTSRKADDRTTNLTSKSGSWAASPDRRHILSVDARQTWKIWNYRTNDVIQGTSAIPIGNDVRCCISLDGQSISLVSQEHLELISVNKRKSVQIRLPMIVGAMRFLTHNRLEIVGINLGFKNFPLESVVYIQVDPFKQYEGALYSGPFGDQPVRGSSSFQFAGPDRFVQCSTKTDGNSVAILWDNRLKTWGTRGFSTAVKVEDATTNGNWILVSEPAKSMCYILDATSKDLPTESCYPMNGSVFSGAIHENGDLVTIGYGQCGTEVFQRVRR